MRDTEYFKDKKITIVGLARSGLACANLLSGLGAYVSITESKDNPSTRQAFSALNSREIETELGAHTRPFIAGRDMIVVSPGVPDTAAPLVWAKEFNIPAVSEIEIAYLLCPATIIAVTGTNGKTTVTTLIGKVLEAAGAVGSLPAVSRVFVCGNIGVPFCSQVEKMREEDFVSLEVSSFQLEKSYKFKPKISVILNFNRNHLDRHSSMEEYLQAKKRIFKNQDSSDQLVLNYDDPVLRALAEEAQASVAYFEKIPGLNPNESAVALVSSLLGVDQDIARRVFADFKGLEHRLEYVCQINGVKFINDSKATTVNSTIWALENMTQPVVLIAGGRDKGNDYHSISGLVRKKAKEIILIGEAKEKIKKDLQSILPVEEAATLQEAVKIAFLRAGPDSCVLFSPMCASFDMFSDYEERGRVFKQAVNELAREFKTKNPVKNN